MFRKSDDQRRSRRLARIARWDRPLVTTGDRLRAYFNMIFVDHGIFRLFYLNKHNVDGKLFRAAQPWPHQIRAFARQGGKTVVYLRGGHEHGSWPLEQEAAKAANVQVREFLARSREAPDREMLLAAPAFFSSLQYPAMVHCKSGADRAGFMAALYSLVHLKQPANEALKQLSSRYGHFRWSKTGVLDRFFEIYRDEAEAKGIPYEIWVRDHYDPQKLQREFREGFWSNLIVDRILHRE
jgi:protein tyrosine/serine phosphatase